MYRQIETELDRQIDRQIDNIHRELEMEFAVLDRQGIDRQIGR